MKLLIVGGVAGGASAAARSRRLSQDAQIVVVTRRRGFVDMRLLLSAAILAVAAQVLRAEDPKSTHSLRPPAHVTWIAFTPDSKLLLTGGSASPNVADEHEYELRLWNVETGKLAAGVGASGVVSPDGRSALTGGTGGELRLWKLPELASVTRVRLGDLRVHRVAFRPDGKAFAALLRYGPNDKDGVSYKAFTVDTATGRTASEPVSWQAEQPLGFPVGRPSTGPPAGWTAGNDPLFDREGVLVRPAGRAAEPLEVPGDDDGCGGPLARAISRDGKRAVSAGCNGQVVVWDYPARKVVGKPLTAFRRLRVRDPGLAIAANGRRAAVASMAENAVQGNLLSLTM